MEINKLSESAGGVELLFRKKRRPPAEQSPYMFVTFTFYCCRLVAPLTIFELTILPAESNTTSITAPELS